MAYRDWSQKGDCQIPAFPTPVLFCISSSFNKILHTGAPIVWKARQNSSEAKLTYMSSRAIKRSPAKIKVVSHHRGPFMLSLLSSPLSSMQQFQLSWYKSFRRTDTREKRLGGVMQDTQVLTTEGETRIGNWKEQQKPRLVPEQCFDHSAEDYERQLPAILTGWVAPARPVLPNLSFKLLPSLQQ